MKVRLPKAPLEWSYRFQQLLQGEIERGFERIYEYARVPNSGTTGQALVKATDRDYDLTWGSGIKACGTATFAAGTSVAVTLSTAEPDTSYYVVLGGNAAGYCWVTAKATTGFTINCSAINSNAVDWVVIR